MGWLIAAIVMATVGGAVGGGIAVLGLVEATSGRIQINIRNLPWSRRDAQVIGLCRVAQGVLITAQTAVIAVMFATQLSVPGRIALPVFWMLWIPFGVALSIPAAVQVRMSRRTGVPLF